MARYTTSIRSTLSAADAFEYMADFSNALVWDPSVSVAHRVGSGPLAVGAEFELVARFAGRDVPLLYRVAEIDVPHRIVLEAVKPGFASRDTITVEPSDLGSVVHYDAVLAFSGSGRLFDPLMQLVFNRVGAKARAGMATALNP
ncbi:MAG: SRPBCC family protein [Actinomycetes bacterium]